MDKPKILIVGAGALGITIGYHLSLSGANITYLVRPAKVASIQAPLALYCYDDGKLKQFNDYQIISSVAEINNKSYDFVLVTLDGTACESEEGSQLLEALGNALRDTNAVVMLNGVGATQHCKEMLKFPEHRIMEGTMAILSYQTDRVTLPANPPTNSARLAESSIAYHHGTNKLGFMVADRPKQTARHFAELYSRSGMSQCDVVNQTIYRMFTASFFPIMAIYDLAGWPNAETLAKDKRLMKLGCSSMKEILRLPEFGWRGKLASLLLMPKLLEWQNAKFERDCLPVDYSAFNKFHHGGKVRDQDLASMQKSLASGISQGLKMPALTQLIDLYEQHMQR